MPDEINLTKEQIVETVCKEYGVASLAELRKVPEFGRSFATYQDLGLVLKKGLRYRYHEGVTVPGFYLRHNQFTEWDPKTKTRTVKNEGAQVLLSDGSSPITIYGHSLKGTAPMARVVIGPVRVRRDIYTGSAEVILIPAEQGRPGTGTQVRVQDHDAPVPDVPLDAQIRRCLQVQSEGKNARGVVYGDSGNFPVFGTLTIGDREQVAYFQSSSYSNEPSLKVTAQDSRGKWYTLKLDVQRVCEAFGLTPQDSKEAFKDALANEPIAVNGKLGVLLPKSLDDFGDRQQEALDAIAQLAQMGLIKPTNREAPDKSKLNALFLKGYLVDNGQGGQAQPVSIRIADLDVYDIQESVKFAGGSWVKEWRFFVLAEENGKHPWVDAQEHRGVKNDRAWEMNVGAFVVFLNHTGKATLAADDPFAVIGAEMQSTLGEFAPVAASS